MGRFDAHSVVPQDPNVKHMVEEGQRPARIKRVAFGLQSGPDMIRSAEIHVTSKELYKMPTRTPAENGCLDPRLGVSDKKSICKTCNKNLADCTGHFGYIRLELPVFHIGYFKATVSLLQMICKTCSRVLLTEPERARYLRLMRDPRVDTVRRSAVFKSIMAQCKKHETCPHCEAVNGTIKKVAGAQALRIVHDVWRPKVMGEAHAEYVETLRQATGSVKDIEPHLAKALEDMTPDRVWHIFSRVPDQDLGVLWTSELYGRPEHLIMTHIPVPPVCIRPSVAMDVGGGSNEDDLTVKLQEIIHANTALRLAMRKGSATRNIRDVWDYLQVQVAQFVNGEIPGLPASMKSTKAVRGLCQRLKGKQGRFRGNLSGKRVDFSARTVISPDPNLAVDEVAVPELVAKALSFPERVTDHNLRRLRDAVTNGPRKWPGANYVRSTGNRAFALQYGDRTVAADRLRVGDVVERHLVDGDIVLFNRQPSLHKMSIMSHRVRVMPWRTFRFNECVCAPYNADFDGDEMNLHVPQTEEARAEALTLMNVKPNFITPRNGEPLVSACQDFLTGAYLLTRRDIWLTRDDFCRICAFLGDAGEHVDLPLPAIIKPIPLWSGKQVFDVLLCPSAPSRRDLKVNLELKERNYSGPAPESGVAVCMCPNDGYVVIRNSQVLAGNLCKSTLGGSKKGLFFELIRDHSVNEAARCMQRLTKGITRWLTDYGFSIGINDVIPSADLNKTKENVIRRNYKRCYELIDRFRRGKLVCRPGCNEDETLESEMSGLLSDVRDLTGQECMRVLPTHNAPKVMATCGSKGSALNICQMVACVGQQVVNGHRIPNGFVNRTLPHFEPHAKAPAAKGFVANSFYSGLNAMEFFFHTMGGREGLVDTAVKTAETGYMQRRLVKALEDLSTAYDSTVRSASNSIVQFRYGDDGLNPSYMERNDRPVDFDRLHGVARACLPRQPSEPFLLPSQIVAMAEEELGCEEMASLGLDPASKFIVELRDYARRTGDHIAHMRKVAGLPTDAPAVESAASGGVDADPRWLRLLRERLQVPGATVSVPDMPEFQQWKAAVERGDGRARRECMERLVACTSGLTARQLRHVFEVARSKYRRAYMEPGEAAGAIAAQSIGEPGTQMTLKTFHFAGVASMDITLGVPRIKEIINATKNISTPIITAELMLHQSERTARLVKARIEKTTLGQVTEHMREFFTATSAFIEVKLHADTIRKLQLNLDASTVKRSLVNAGLKLKPENVAVKVDDGILQVFAPRPTGVAAERLSGVGKRGAAYFSLQHLKQQLPEVIVQGIPGVRRAVINRVEDDNDPPHRFNLLVEGAALLNVMGTPGVNGPKTRGNHIMEAEQVLGIEAARTLIIKEVAYTYGSYGMDIDARHLMLLADVMTFKGQVLGITRFGIAKMKESVFMLASFEKTADHLFDAALHGRVDTIDGVSECIIMGIPMPVGSGAFDVLHDDSQCGTLPALKPQVRSAQEIPRMSTLKRVQIFAEDMNEEMRDKAVELAQDAMYTTYAEGKVFPQVSEAVRSGMDKEYGQGWNCVVGGAFGAFVTHRTKTYMYFSVFQGVSILLWRA